MAITEMAKVIIVSHQSQASQLLEALQDGGIFQVLNAEEAMVCKDWPDLCCAAVSLKEVEEIFGRLTKSVDFLKSYTKKTKSLAGILSPQAVIDQQSYKQAISDKSAAGIIEESLQCQMKIENLKTECENIDNTLEKLLPWSSLTTPVEEINQLQQTACLTGLLPSQNFAQISEELEKTGAAIETVGTTGTKYACVIACMNANAAETQRLLRSADFETVSFEGMAGAVAELITQNQKKLSEAKSQLKQQYDKALSLSRNLLKLEILHDHYSNLLQREQTKGTAPATQQTVILEGWVKKQDFQRLEKIVSGFSASSLSRIEPAQDEEIPVEIENRNYIRPFEVITRLYGMPQHFEIDPTTFLAPFFALFFALCLTDAGYGLVLIALMALFIKKMHGDKKLMWMLGICSVFTVGAGALTGGWFGDAIQQFIPVLKPLREKMIWFDPLEKPMMFFYLSLALGYFQILTGLVIALIHNLCKKQYIAALCDQLTWLVMLNSIVIFGASKFGAVPAGIGSFSGKLAIIPAVTIFLFSQRQGNWAGRLGMGLYNLFSTIFYMGDVLSYLRLMALGMVTAGLAMAINVMAKVAVDILHGTFGLPYAIGIAGMIIVLLLGHSFNLVLSGLSAFVHTLRLQYVEFFPKFFIGGGKSFEPLAKEYKHIYIKKSKGSF